MQNTLDRLSEELDNLTPELRKAAVYVLENPNQVGVSSIRVIADAAGVKPNSLVRMARSVGFDGFDDFRSPFKEELSLRGPNFSDRARWLQSLSSGGKLGNLYGNMASSAMQNIEHTFAATDAKSLRQAARNIIRARRTMILGVGANYMLAENFAYLADMATSNIQCIPRPGCSPLDDLSRADRRDLLIAITFKPYRAEVMGAIEVAQSRGVKLIGISDSEASPLVAKCKQSFLVRTGTPQFFPSTAALMALLESLIAFIVAESGDDTIASIEEFHNQREALGVYTEPVSAT